MKRPFEALLLQPLQPETKARPLPVQDLDLVAPLVDEAEQVLAERIVLERRLDHHRETIDAHPEVDRIAAEIDRDVANRRRRHRR